MSSRRILTTATAFFCLVAVPVATASSTPIPVPLRGAMVPSGYNTQNQYIGFDNNDPEVLFTVIGFLENTCHRVGPYTYDIKGDEIVIHQTALDYKGTGKVCIQTKVPFTNDISLPTIEQPNPNYKIIDGTSGKIIGKLPIGKSPVATPDSDLYLNVTDARLWYDPKAKTDKWRVVVVGMINRACTTLKKVHVDVLKKERAVVVRPVLERDEKVADEDCQPDERIQHSEPISADLAGIWLLHVRSVQGAGKHELVDTQSIKLP